MENSFLTIDELVILGLKHFGKNPLISRKASFYTPENIEIGDNVRIDDFCILSGNITLGSYIHISAHTCLYGSKGIIINDFSGLSTRTIVLSASDDFGGDYLIGPMVPPAYTNVTGGPVIIKRYVQVGAGSTIFPNITIEEGAIVGAMSLITNNIESWAIYAGVPAKFIKQRKSGLLLKAQCFLENKINVQNPNVL